MTFRNEHPDFAAIENHIKRARIERSLVIGQMISNGLFAVARLFGRPAHTEVERKHIATDAFLRRSIQ